MQNAFQSHFEGWVDCRFGRFGRASNWPATLENERRGSGLTIYAMPAPERFNRSGPGSAKSRLHRYVPLIAVTVLLSATSPSAQRLQDLRPDSVPLVPSILKSGVTIPEPCPHTASMEPKRYMITWNDTPGIDGQFMLVVHPKQLFLRSGHDNPNPNYVYWVEQLSEGQYARLVKFLDAYNGRLFRRDRWSRWPGYTLFILRNPQISPQPPDPMTPAGGASWRSRADAAVNANLRRILKELNRALVPDRTFRLDAAINSYPNIVRIAEP